MAKMTKEKMMEKLMGLEDKLFDLIPTNEKDTNRTRILDKVSEIVAGNVKATLAEMTAAFNEGTNLLAVEAEVKKQSKSSTKNKAEEKSVDEEKPKKKLSKKNKAADTKKTNETEEQTAVDTEEETLPAPAEKKEKKSTKKSEKKEEVFKFPEVLETEEDGNYEMADIRGIQDIEEGDLIACEWTKEELEEYEYDNTGVLPTPTAFEQDIDVLIVVDVYEDVIAYGLSLGTHKMYHFLKEDVQRMVSNGMPWRVYKPVE